MDAALLVSSADVTLRPMYIPSSYSDRDKKTVGALLVSLCSNRKANATMDMRWLMCWLFGIF